MTNLEINEELVEEIRQAIVEGEFASRWGIIETYHHVGKTICGIRANRSDLLQALAPRVGKSVRMLWYATKFYETYPTLDTLPEGKNVSMNKIINKYLTDSKQEKCNHPEDKLEIISFNKCTDCGKTLDKVKVT